MKHNKKIKLEVLIVFFLINIYTYTNGQDNTPVNDRDDVGYLKSMFANPPSSFKPLTWWHWMNGHISKTGIERDLQMMKEVGIKGFVLFETGHLPEGNVRFNSELWWEHVEFAIKTADRLDLKFGAFNCNGWGMSGGPWMSIEQSMKELTHSDTIVKGGKTFNAILPLPKYNEIYERIAVIAYPQLLNENALVPIDVQIENNLDRKDFPARIHPSTEIIFDNSKSGDKYIIYDFGKNMDFRSMDIISPVSNSGYAQLEYSGDGEVYQKVDNVLPLDFRAKGNVKSTTLSFSKVTARYMKLTFIADDVEIGKVNFYKVPRLLYWEPKSGSTERVRHDMQLRFIEDLKLESGDNYQHDELVKKNQIIDLSEKVDNDGKLIWNIPPGEWVIEQIGYTSTLKKNGPATKEGTGYESDKMNKEATQHHFNSYIGKMNQISLDKVGKPVSYMQMESWEAGHQNWTQGFEEEFEKRNGYSIIPWLPTLTKGIILNSEKESNKFLWDVRNTIVQLIAENYSAVMYEMAKERGIEVLVEGSGQQSFFYDALRHFQYSDIPMGEFWTLEGFPRPDCKNASSVAHLMGKKVVAAESFTGRGDIWRFDPFYFKRLGDEAFTVGVNQFVFHTYVHQPYEIGPGMTLSRWGNHFQRHNVWYPHSQGWMKYLQRCQYLLQQGSLVTDVCYFVGEGIPSYLGMRDELNPAIPDGLDYDGINLEFLQKTIVENGKIVLPEKASWHVLVIRDGEKMTPELLKELIRLAEAGATIMAIKPEYSPSFRNYPDSDEDIEEIVAKHWNKKTKGEFIWGVSLGEVLEKKQVASDFSFKNQEANLKYTHRRVGEKDIYFVSNQSDKKISTQCSFRTTGQNPEIWNPDNGEIRAIGYSTENGQTLIDLDLDEYGSCFVVFGNPKTITEDKYIATDTINLNGSWDLKFDIFGEKIIDTTFTKLIDWTVCENPDIKYHSGTVVYSYILNLKTKKGRKYHLDLGNVNNVAEVFINGKYVANLWKPDYQVDITQCLEKGQNQIEIHVTNTTINKLIGDERFPKDVRYSSDPLNPSIARFPEWINNPSGRNSKRKTFVTYNPEKSDDPLQPSGMVGPVRIIVKTRLK